MTPLYVIFAMVILGVLTVAVDSAQVFIYQRTLHSIADGAALAAADGINEEAIYTGGLGEGKVKLAEAQARENVREYMDSIDKEGVECTEVTVDQTRVTVLCRGTAKLPLVNQIISDAEVPVESRASAEGFTLG